jgi:ankyrin repeat protein
LLSFLTESGRSALDTVDIENWTTLSWALKRGHEGIVKLLLEKGADANAADRAGWTPLRWATQNGHVDVVKLLSVAATTDD